MSRTYSVISSPGSHIVLGMLLGGLLLTLSFGASASQLSNTPLELPFNNYPTGMEFGWSAALSANGNVAVLGGPGSGSVPGGAALYTLSAGIWSNAILLSTSGIPNGVQAGWAVGLSADGTQAFMGVPDINTYTGAVYIYTESGGSWNNTPIRTTLTLPAGLGTKSSFGSAIATSADGQTLVIGADAAAGGGTTPGAVYVYTLNNGAWSSPITLSATGIKPGSELGGSLAVSSNGQIIVAGTAQATSAVAYVYTQTNGTWSTPVALPLPAGGTSINYPVAISADGTEILAGAPNSNGNAGGAYVYTFAAGKWTLTHTFTVANSGSLGYSVGLSPDGSVAFFANLATGGGGSIYASTNSNGTWGTPASLSVTGVGLGDDLGSSLAVGQAGQVLLTGAIGANANTGAGFIFSSPAAISLAITPSVNPVSPGANLTFNLSFTNADQPGSLPATTLSNVVLTDTLPSGVSYVSSDAANGSCNNSGSTVTCTLASLPPGNDSQNPWSPSITVKAPSSTGSFTDTVTATADQPLVGTSAIGTTVTVSSGSSGSSSSGKSGGGTVGLWTLAFFCGLLGLASKRKIRPAR